MRASFSPPPILYAFVAITAGGPQHCEALLITGSFEQMEALYHTHFAEFAEGELREGSPALSAAGFYIDEAASFDPAAHPLDFFAQHPSLRCRGFYGVGSQESPLSDLPLLRQALMERMPEGGAKIAGSMPFPWLYEAHRGATSRHFVESHEALRQWAQALAEKEILALQSPAAPARAKRAL